MNTEKAPEFSDSQMQSGGYVLPPTWLGYHLSEFRKGWLGYFAVAFVVFFVCLPAFIITFPLMALWVWMKELAGFMAWTITETIALAGPFLTGVYHRATIWKSSGKL